MKDKRLLTASVPIKMIKIFPCRFITNINVDRKVYIIKSLTYYFAILNEKTVTFCSMKLIEIMEILNKIRCSVVMFLKQKKWKTHPISGQRGSMQLSLPSKGDIF